MKPVFGIFFQVNIYARIYGQKSGEHIGNSATSVQALYDFLKIFRPERTPTDSINTHISLDGDSATIRNFSKNVTNRSRNGKSAVEG